MSSFYDDEPLAPTGRVRVPAPGDAPGFGNGHGDYRDAPLGHADGHDDYGDGGYGVAGYDVGGYGDSAYGDGGYGGSGYGDAPLEVRPAFGGSPAEPPPTRPSPTGRAAVGRAGVSSTAEADPFDPFTDSPSNTISGRASVPAGIATGADTSAPITGRATVGRATVAPTRISPDGAPISPAGPSGPDRPDGPPGATGPAKGPGKKARRRRRLLYGLAALIMFVGFAIMGITYYSSTIPTPEQVPLKQATKLYYSDGKTVLAQIGTVNRTIISDTELKPWVKQAVIATEDATFYSNIGVDVKGIARAFVNNITGGQTQGASTITQQYARYVVNDYSASYTRKAREIVLAIKMNQNMTKEQILLAYLNTVDFGRGAYGIEAAAQAYFGVHASQLTPAQAMVLAGLIKSPESGEFSPTCVNDPNDKNSQPPCDAAKGRFEYTKAQMKKVTGPGFLAPADVDQLVYPSGKQAAVAWKGNAAVQAVAGPNGFIVHQVMSELSALKDPQGNYVFPHDNTNPDSLLNGGWQIVTTIDYKAQQAAIRYASKASTDAPVHKLVAGIGAALVATQPGTGNVIAYYGGSDDGSGLDYAGIWDDPVTAKPGLTGANVYPGSNFKTVTMATALSTGMSVKSMWYGPYQRVFKERGAAGPVYNASRSEVCGTQNNFCTMQQGLAKSLNTMYYAIGTDTKGGMSPAKIVDTAYYLGINHIWGGAACGGKRQDLNGKNGAELTGNRCIGAEVSFGQFGVALQDLSNVMATYANHGVKATQHFVRSVTRGTGTTKETIKLPAVALTTVPGYSEPQNNDLTWSMESVFKNANERANQLAGDRPAAVKTGTWELGPDKLASQNGTLMFSGFTAGDASSGQIAVSVWIGNNGTHTVKGKAVPVAITSTDGSSAASSGPPAKTFQLFVDAYENNGPGGKPWPIKQFADPSFTGDPSKNDPMPMPSPSQPTPSNQNPGCKFLLICPSGGPGGGGPGGGGGGGGGGTPGSGDTEPPGVPGSLTATVTGPNQVTLAWQPSGDNVGVVRYIIYRGGHRIGQSADASFTDRTVKPLRTYNYTVTAVDAAGNESAMSNVAQATT